MTGSPQSVGYKVVRESGGSFKWEKSTGMWEKRVIFASRKPPNNRWWVRTWVEGPTGGKSGMTTITRRSKRKSSAQNAALKWAAKNGGGGVGGGGGGGGGFNLEGDLR